MKFSWNEIIIWLCLLSLTFSLGAELISDYTGTDSWSILYFGIGLAAIAILIIILKFKKNK
jgi:LPXTG-motif cell wall-anchored protein